MKYFIIVIAALTMVPAHPPDAPLTEYEGAKMAMGLYFDHSGQDLFETNTAPSVLNSSGAQLTFAPIKYLHLGGYLGAAEFDHLSPVNSGESVFNSNYSFTWGGSGKLFTPRFIAEKVCLFLSGSAGMINAEDKNKNTRELWEYHGILGLQYQPVKSFNIGLGGIG